MPAKKSEIDLRHSAKIYDDIETQTENKQPVENELWPLGDYRQAYSNYNQKIFLAGLIRNTTGGPVKKMDWLEGIQNVYEFWTNVAFASVDDILEAQARFFYNGNTVDANLKTTITVVNTTSQAAYVHTCPANHVQELNLLTVRNSTRAPTASYAFTPNGGTAQIFSVPVAGTAAASYVLIGGHSRQAVGTSSKMTSLWLQAGDTVEASIDNFVAADVVRHDFEINDYTI